MKAMILMSFVLAAPALSEESKSTVGLEPSVISEVVNRGMPKFSACYAEDGKSSGKVIIKILIGPEGRVLEASVSSTTLKSSKVELCVADTIKSLEFPKPAGGAAVEVAYPFDFSPGPVNNEKTADKPKKKKQKAK